VLVRSRQYPVNDSRVLPSSSVSIGEESLIQSSRMTRSVVRQAVPADG
jgi:hypothetical protein